jgi:rubrerythrin
MKQMTEKSLHEAFAGESMAHMKYLIFSEVAEKASLPKLARMFRAIAFAEQVHATNHARNLGYIKETPDNLQSCIDGEDYEVDEMYPAFLAISELQKEKGATKSFHYAIEAEKIHAKIYKEAKKMVSSGKDLDIAEVYICPICGYTHYKDAPPENCPVCGVTSKKFKKF